MNNQYLIISFSMYEKMLRVMQPRLEHICILKWQVYISSYIWAEIYTRPHIIISGRSMHPYIIWTEVETKSLFITGNIEFPINIVSHTIYVIFCKYISWHNNKLILSCLSYMIISLFYMLIGLDFDTFMLALPLVAKSGYDRKSWANKSA